MTLRIAVILALCSSFACPCLRAQDVSSLPLFPGNFNNLSSGTTPARDTDLPRAPEPHAREINSSAPLIHVPRQTDSPVRGVIQRPFRAWLTLSLMGQAAVLADVKTTLDLRRAYPLTFREADPLARPFVNMPTTAYTAASVGLTAGLNLVSWKLTRSENIWLRGHWWLPQTAQIVINAECAAFNARQ